ncbi:MAG: type III-B CRISPR-associated protein Cas10/Cmr2, partial [Pyrobaculum sp.]
MKDFFELKVYALLHDPPDKMWTLFRGVDHVERAREIYDRVFKGTVFGGGVPPGSHPVVDRADQMAAAMDRYIHYQRQPQRDIVVYKRLHNIFAPSHSVEIEDIPTQKVEEYVSELAESINRFCKGSDEEAARRCYHVFYALYEGLWIKEGLPPSLADTRAPTHDVFDHLYATAMLINWLYGGADRRTAGQATSDGSKVDGFLVAVDIPGVQSFVSAARKAGDFWAGSWIISTAVWLTVWPLVWEYGPDILIRPTARLNPYYYASLTHKVPDVKSHLDEILATVIGLKKDRGPSLKDSLELLDQAVLMPLIGESAVLALPKFKPDGGQWTPEDLKSYIKNRFVDVLDALSKLAMGHDVGDYPILTDLAAGPQRKIFKAIEKQIGCSLLRLPLRVTVVDVGEFYKSLECPLGGRGEDSCKSLFFFHKLWTEALGKAAEEQSRRFVPTAGPWFQQTDNFDKAEPMCKPLYSDPTGYRLSSISGEPAVIGVRKEPGGEYNMSDFKNLVSQIGAGETVGGSEIEQELAALLKPGEFLGPSDLVKRGLYRRASVIDTSESIRDVAKLPKHRFESTEDVAVAVIKQYGERLKAFEKCGKVAEYLNREEGRDLEKIWGNLTAMVKDWGECIKELESRRDGILPSDVFRDTPFTTETPLSRVLGPRLFYAIVRGDGDHVGRLLRGDVEDWCSMAVEVLEEVFRGRDEGERREVVNSLKSLCGITGGRPLVTPTYISAV